MRNGSLLLLAWSLVGLRPAWAQYSGFERFADSGSLRPFARDLGGVLGSASFHTGRSLGFSGFDLGVQAGFQFYPEREDRILRNNGVRAFGFPWAQAAVGMPFKFDGFVRGTSFEGLTVAGGGLRYGLLKPADKPWAPQLLLSALGHAAVHQNFSASHLGLSLVASMGVPVFTPYLGVGLDRTRLLVRSSTLDPSLNGASVTTLESRLTAGMNLKPWHFLYLHLAYVLLHGQSGAEAGLGLRF